MRKSHEQNSLVRNTCSLFKFICWLLLPNMYKLKRGDGKSIWTTYPTHFHQTQEFTNSACEFQNLQILVDNKLDTYIHMYVYSYTLTYICSYSTCIYSAIIPLQLTFTKLANFSHPSDLIIINISSMFMILILAVIAIRKVF